MIRLTMLGRPPRTNGHDHAPAEIEAIVYPGKYTELKTTGGRVVTLSRDDMRNFLAAILMADGSAPPEEPPLVPS